MKVLLSIIVVGCITQVFAQTDIDNSTFSGTEIGSSSLIQSENKYPVDKATFFKKLLWGLNATINIDGAYKLVPLFGYSSSTLKANKEIDWDKVDTEIKNGNIFLVVLEPESPDKEGYVGQGIIVIKQEDIIEGRYSEQSLTAVSSDSNTSLSADNMKKLLETVDSTYSSDHEILFAFTRPLAKLDFEEEFIGGLNLWHLPE